MTNKYLKSIFESMSMTERMEDVMRKTGLFAEEEIRKLSKENIMLKETVRLMTDEKLSLTQRIKDLEDVCDGSCFSDETDDRDEKIAKMQDRIDSDCVRINRLKVTINTLVDMYGLLRNQVGMD